MRNKTRRDKQSLFGIRLSRRVARQRRADPPWKRMIDFFCHTCSLSSRFQIWYTATLARKDTQDATSCHLSVGKPLHTPNPHTMQIHCVLLSAYNPVNSLNYAPTSAQVCQSIARIESPPSNSHAFDNQSWLVPRSGENRRDNNSSPPRSRLEMTLT